MSKSKCDYRIFPSTEITVNKLISSTDARAHKTHTHTHTHTP